MSVTTYRRSSEDDDTARRILDLLETKNAKPLEMAKNEILHDEFANINLQRISMRKILRHFSKKWLQGVESYAVGPAIMALACEAVGGEPEATVPAAAAIILIGSGAEIHDDIIDRSKTKNSRFTIFGEFGSSRALITGDMLLTKGFALLYENPLEESALRRTALVVKTIKRAVFEHADAELLALDFKGRWDITPEEYMRVIRMRSSVVEAQARIGAFIGGGAPKDINALGKYGRLLGTLSLIRGEFIDVFETEELDHRIKNECLPLPILVALHNAKEKQRIIELLRKRSPRRKDINTLLQRVLRTPGLGKLKREMRDMAKAADLSIATLRPEPVALLHLLTKATLAAL